MGVLGQVLLDERLWRARAAAHEARADALVGEHLDRRRQGEKHPVHDFLFTYYSFRPAQLRRWTPGFGVVCLTTRDGASSGTRPAPEPVTVDDVTGESPWRLYAAEATELWVLCPREPRQACPRHGRDDHLGDAQAAGHGETLLPQIDEEHLYLAAIVGIHGSGRIEHRDPMPEGEARAGAHLGLVAGLQLDREPRRHQGARKRREDATEWSGPISAQGMGAPAPRSGDPPRFRP